MTSRARPLTRAGTLMLLAALLVPPAAEAQTSATEAPAAPEPAAPATPVPAPAPTKPAPLFTLYGTFNVNAQLTQARGATSDGADVEGRGAVSIDSSNLGVRGAYELPIGFSIVYQCETGASLDGINNASLCNRNSRVGFSSRYGTLFYGNWDTPFKTAIYGTKVDDPFTVTDVFGFAGVLSSPGFNYRSGGWVTGAATPVIGFDIRANNSIAYHSPVFAGLSVKLQYSVNEFKNASGTQDPALYSASASYDVAGFSFIAAYELHRDGFALVGINGDGDGPYTFGATAANTAGSATEAAHTSDVAWRVGAGYQLDWAAGATTVGALYEQLSLEQDDAPVGALEKYERAAWQVSLKHRYEAWELRARYSRADAGDATVVGGGGDADDHGASNLALGAAYFFAKSTQVYLQYAQIWNEDNARYTFPVGGAQAVVGPNTPAGADPVALGLGVRHQF